MANRTEISGYARLKSLTGGEGTFTMDFNDYAQVPGSRASSAGVDRRLAVPGPVLEGLHKSLIRAL